MSDSIRVISNNTVLGNLQVVHADLNTFPFQFFVNSSESSEVNCCYMTANDHRLNDIRLWVNKECMETVFIKRKSWSPYHCIIAFMNKDDSVKFALNFGDLIEAYDA